MLQRLAQVTGAVYPDAVSFQSHPRKSLTELDIHILQEGLLGKLRPGGYLREIGED
jgi:hypothetical protein